MSKKAMKLALEALKRMKRYGNTFGYRSNEQNPYEQVCEAIEALEALAQQPAQRPIKTFHDGKPWPVQEPAQQPFGYFKAEPFGWTDCAETDEGAVALYERPLAQQEPVNKYCCHLCFNKSGQIFMDRMILCPECGNKRCPKATHHGLPCTKSNDVGQRGSIYDQPPQRTWVGLTKTMVGNHLRRHALGEQPTFRQGFKEGVAFAELKLKEHNI